MISDVSHQVLLRTKLHRPRVTADLVHRPRLKALLDRGMDRPLILVAAPPGFGKSTLLSAWLEAGSPPSAWLSLDERDNDLGVFSAYFVGAVQTIFPDALAETQRLLSGFALPPVPILAGTLVNELDALARDFVLVLDDYHAIHEQSIHDLLSAILRHPPKGMHLVITTRQDPPLPLGVLRARAQLTEIRGQELRFTLPETAAFVAHTLGKTLPDDAIAILAEKTEGWATGLRLAMLTLRQSEDITGLIAGLHAENRYVMDYLISEGLARVPPPLESFLLKTSILNRMCAPLCAEVIGSDRGEPQSQAWLAWLEQNGIFTVSLDSQGRWYRYHHLFQTLMQERLARAASADEIAVMHRRASAWFAANGFLEEALQHALAAQDVEAAVRLVAQHRHMLLDTEQRPRLARWLHVFPGPIVVQHPDLLLAAAWIAELDRADSRTVADLLDRAQALVNRMAGEPERGRHLQGEIDALRSIEATFAANDPADVIALATRALETMPQTWYMARVEAWLQLASAYGMSGQLERAYEVLATAQRGEAANGAAPRARLLASQCFLDWMAADLPRLLQSAHDTVSAGQATEQQLESLGWGHYFLASGYYQRNDLAAAELHANAVQKQRHVCHRICVVQSAVVLAAIHQARGQADEARLALDRARAYLAKTRSEALLPLVQAFEAELAATQGDLDTAGRWAADVGRHMPPGLMAFFYAPQLTLPKILLAQNTPASRGQAAEALSRLHDFVTQTHNTRFTIEVLALQALLQGAQGDEPAALALLGQAVRLAEPGGFIRLFVDLGLRMANLLTRLWQTDPAPAYTGRILGAFDQFSSAAPSRRAAHQAAVSPRGQPELVEPLTDREQEVLAHLAQRLSNKEIAQKLVISPQTVKRHTVNLYQKLQVSGRREAVEKAHRLGLL